MDLSIVIPAYNERKSIPLLYSKLKNVLSQVKKSYEIIFIDDGSRDGTTRELDLLKGVTVIHFARNQGKAEALSRGFKQAKGDLIITLDADLQDDPAEIPRFLEAVKKNDMVVGWKFRRKDPWTKKIPSKFFNYLTQKVTGIKIHDVNCGFKIMKAGVAKSLNIYGELHRYIPVLARWGGYTVGEIKVRHAPRRYGKSKYGVSRVAKGFFDLVTIKFMSRYGKRPLHLFGAMGFICTILGVALGLMLTIEWFQGVPIGSRPLLLLAILLVVIGIQFISLGLLGEMIIRNKM